MPAFVYVPLPCIAAILITAASGLIPFGVMADLINYDIAEFLILIVTCGICVLVDGAVGLMVGGVVSILRTAIKTSMSECCSTRMSDEGTVLICQYTGQISYVNAMVAEKVAQDQIMSHSRTMASGSLQYVLMDLRDVTFFDIDGIEVIKSL